MTSRFGRGSAPGRARSAEDRTGSFKKGHQKVGGRRKGTPNSISANLKGTLIEVADRVGSKGIGKDGLIGYLRFVARRYPKTFASLLGCCLPIEDAELERSRHQPISVYEFNKSIENLIRVEKEYRPRPSTIDGRPVCTTQSLAEEAVVDDEDPVETSAAAHPEPQNSLHERLDSIEAWVRDVTRTKYKMPLRPSTTMTLHPLMGPDTYADMLAALANLVVTAPKRSRSRKLPRPSPSEPCDAMVQALLGGTIDHEDLVDGLST